LKKLGYSLQTNAKVLEGGDYPDRDKQFQYINKLSEEYLARELPVISVDSKKKELVGNYKNPGFEWEISGQPVEVNVYDFQDKEVEIAVP